MKTVNVDPNTLRSLPTANPNVMEPAVFERLCAAIQAHGFLQPVLIVDDGEGYVLVDGEHRRRVARVG